MTRSRMRLALALLGWLALLPAVAAPAPTDTTAAILDRALVDRLGERNLRQLETTVETIAATGDARALALLEALQDGRLYRDETGRVVIAAPEGDPRGGFVDPLGGDAGDLDAQALRQIRVSNRIRRALRTAISELSLTIDDPVARGQAARRFIAAPDADLLPLLRRVLEEEPDAAVAADLRAAVAATLLTDPPAEVDAAAQLDAVALLRDHGGQDARNALAALQAPQGSELAAARDGAIEAIDTVAARWAFAQNVWFGLSLGSVLLLAAMGLAITFGVMGVINMAHGEMVMLGAYTTFATQQLVAAVAPGLMDYSLLLALPAAFLVSGGVGMALERTVIQRLYRRPLDTLLATWGVSLLLQQAVRTLFGASNRPVEAAAWMDGALTLGGLGLTYNRLVILLFSLAVLAMVMLLLRRSRLGLEIRAVTQNRAMAEAVGIRTRRVDMITFALGSGIAGIAGVALSQIDNVSPNLGQNYIIDSFMVIVFGGVGNLAGTLVGAMTLGVTTKAAEPWIGAVAAKVLILVFIILFIQFRPRGLFPQRGRAAG